MADSPQHQQPSSTALPEPGGADTSGKGEPGEGEGRGEGARSWLHVRAHPIVATAVWLTGIALVLYFWESLTFVALLLLAAGTAAAVVKPLVKKLPWRHSLSGIVVGMGFVLLVLGTLALVGWLVSGPISRELEHWPQTKQQINQQLAQWSQWLGLANPLTVEALINNAMAWLTGEGGFLATAASAVSTILVMVAVLAFGTIYLLSQPPRQITGPLSHMLPHRRGPTLHAAMRDLEPRLRWWLLGKLTSMTAVAVLAGVAFWAINLKFPFTLAMLAGVAEIVPTLGPAIAFAVALLVALTQGTTQVVGVIVIYGAIQMIESYILLPLVMRQAVEIPPLITLFSIVLWASLFGPLGLVLALPLDLTIWTAIDRFMLRDPHSATTPPDQTV